MAKVLGADTRKTHIYIIDGIMNKSLARSSTFSLACRQLRILMSGPLGKLTPASISESICDSFYSKYVGCFCVSTRLLSADQRMGNFQENYL